MRTIYRADRIRPIFCLLLGGSFVAACGFRIVAVGARPELTFVALLGGVIVSVGVCILLTRVVVDGSSLEKRAPFAGGVRASWDDIDFWWVDQGSIEEETLPQACFRLRGRRRHRMICAADVWHPCFEAFLQQVRAHVANKEMSQLSTAGVVRCGAGASKTIATVIGPHS